jgi:hypothetical protein
VEFEMKVQEALKAAVEALENINNWLPTINQKGLRDYEYEALLKCKSALFDLEKCEPDAEVYETAVYPTSDHMDFAKDICEKLKQLNAEKG